MNRIILCILFSFSITAALSQKVYFIYVQTESDQPFYVKVNDKLYSSAGPGYLILSNLRDTSYNLRIGFPQTKSENSFTISINHKDHGFLLKNFGEKGWGLFDMQTLSVLYPVNTEAKSGTALKDDGKRSSAFTEWLALAIDDPSIKEKPVYAVEDLKKAEVVVKEAVQKQEVETSKTSTEIAKTDAGKIVDQPKVDKPVDAVVKEANKKVDAEEEKSSAPIAKTKPVNIDSSANKDAVKKTDIAKTDPIIVEPEKEAAKKVDVFQEKTGASVAKSEPLRVDTVAVNNVNKKTDVFQQKTGAVVAKIDPAKEASVIEKYKPSQVSKKAESTTEEGFGLVYLDQYNGGTDTIRLLIPNANSAIAETKTLQNPAAEIKPKLKGNTEIKSQEKTPEQTKQQENATTNTKQQPKEELKFLDFGDTSNTVKKQEPIPEKSKEVEKQANDSKETKPSNTYITIEKDKSNKEPIEKEANDSKENKPSNTYITIEDATDKKKCPSVAGDNDFFVLRKRMASQKAEVDMLSQATKYFKTKCFTTYQIKNLSTLFLTDAAKFRFFDAAYAYVADEVNFKTLESEMKDDYYITRFQGMLHKNL